jgi:predicted nucleic acid-binding protein
VAQGLTLVADSSAWIAAYRKESSVIKDQMQDAIQNHVILVPDLVLVEVLRGLPSEKIARDIVREFNNFQTVEIVGKETALKAATHYRLLRSKGVIIRGTIDLLIATWCVENDVPLLHADRDFAGFAEHLGLKHWPTVNVERN